VRLPSAAQALDDEQKVVNFVDEGHSHRVVPLPQHTHAHAAHECAHARTHSHTAPAYLPPHLHLLLKAHSPQVASEQHQFVIVSSSLLDDASCCLRLRRSRRQAARGSSINRAVIAVKNFLSHGKFGTRTRTIVAVTFLICFLLVYVFSPGPTTFEAAPAQPPPIPLSNSTGAQIESQPPVDRYKSGGGGTRALLPSHASNGGIVGLLEGFSSGSPLMLGMMVTMIGAIVAYFKDILSVFKSLFLSLYSDAFAIESSLHLRDDDDNFDHVYKYVCNCCVPRDTMLAVRGQTKGSESTAEEELGRLAALQRQQRDTGHRMRGYHGFSSDSAWEKIPIEMVFRPAHGGTHKFVYSPYKMINDDRKKLWLQHQISKLTKVIETLERQLVDFEENMLQQQQQLSDDFVLHVKPFQLQIEFAQAELHDNLMMADDILQKIKIGASDEERKFSNDVHAMQKQLKDLRAKLDTVKGSNATTNPPAPAKGLVLLQQEVVKREGARAPSHWTSLLQRCNRWLIAPIVNRWVALMQHIYPHIRVTTSEVAQQPNPLSHTMDGRNGKPQHNLHPRVWGRNPSVLFQVVNDAMKWEFDKRPNQKLEVFSWSDSRHYGEGWMKTVTRDARSKSSVFFDGDLMEELIADAKHFYNPRR